MKECFFSRATILMSVSIVLSGVTYVTSATNDYLSPTALVADNQGEIIYIAEATVRAGIRHIQFVIHPEEDAAAIDEYLKSLKPFPSPHLVADKLSESAERGQKIFDKAGCASCHTEPLYTDLKTHDVGTGKDLDKDRMLDTPTLVEVWRTTPYLYDGRAATIEELLTTYNPDDKHGVTSNLTEADIKDLAEFVLSQYNVRKQ